MTGLEMVSIAAFAAAIGYLTLAGPQRPRGPARVFGEASSSVKVKPGRVLLDALDACARDAAAEDLTRRLGRGKARATIATLLADLGEDDDDKPTTRPAAPVPNA